MTTCLETKNLTAIQNLVSPMIMVPWNWLVIFKHVMQALVQSKWKARGKEEEEEEFPVISHLDFSSDTRTAVQWKISLSGYCLAQNQHWPKKTVHDL